MCARHRHAFLFWLAYLVAHMKCVQGACAYVVFPSIFYKLFCFLWFGLCSPSQPSEIRNRGRYLGSIVLDNLGFGRQLRCCPPYHPMPAPSSSPPCSRTFGTNTWSFQALPTKVSAAHCSPLPKRLASLRGGLNLLCSRGKVRMWRNSCVSEHSNLPTWALSLARNRGLCWRRQTFESIILKAAENRL